MNKFKIILILLIILTPFAAVKVSGVLNKYLIVAQTSAVDNGLNFELLRQIADQNKLNNNGQNSSEVLSNNLISTSSAFSANFECNAEISARLALVRFLSQNNKVFELNADNRWPLASITKLMTAIVSLENMDSEKSVALTDQMISVEEGVGGFKAGEIFKAKDLLKALLLISSNGAAEALAQDFGKEKFIDLMNQKAKELHLNETAFFDPSGLSARNQSTPNDILKLMDYLRDNHKEILKITIQKSGSIFELNSNTRRMLSNINEFAGEPNFLGGKTGFTDEAQGNLVSLFTVQQGLSPAFKNEPVVIVVLGSHDRFGDTKKLLNCINP